MSVKKLQQQSNHLAEKIAQKLVHYPILAPITLLLIILLITPFALFGLSVSSTKKLFKLVKTQKKTNQN